MTDRELQSLRTFGVLSDKAADEIVRLRAEVARLTAAHDHKLRAAEALPQASVRDVPNSDSEEAACYRWLLANWGQLVTHTYYEGLGEQPAVREVGIVQTLSPVDPDSLHRAIVRAMSAA